MAFWRIAYRWGRHTFRASAKWRSTAEVMAFTVILTLLTGVLFGLAPALQFSRPDLNHALKEGAAVSAGLRFGRRRGTQSLLVVGEVALALVLLVGAGLLIRSLWRMQRENRASSRTDY